MTKRPEQVSTTEVSIESVMRTAAFRAGVAVARNGRRPRFDEYEDPDGNDDWNYEYGRQS